MKRGKKEEETVFSAGFSFLFGWGMGIIRPSKDIARIIAGSAASLYVGP